MLRLSALPPGAVLGTSSLRRIAQLSRNYPHLKFENIRGNLHTRLRKLDEDGKYDGIVLAAAGIERLGWEDRVNMYLDKHDMLYAVSQGAMAVECRENDVATVALLAPLHHKNTGLRVTAERTFMKALDGGCSVPIGTWSTIEGNSLCVSGAAFSADGSEMLYSERTDILPSLSFSSATNHPFSPSSPTDHLFSPLPHFSYHQLDLIHAHHPPRATADVTAVSGLLSNGTIVHRTGMCCPTRDVTKYDAAESCGRALAAALLEQGAKEVLDRARVAAGAVDVRQAPTSSSRKLVGNNYNSGDSNYNGSNTNGSIYTDSLSGNDGTQASSSSDETVVGLEEKSESLKRACQSNDRRISCKKSKA